MTAVMAGHSFCATALMKTHAHVASRTFRDVSALLALQCRCPCTSRAEDHDLTSVAERLAYMFNQLYGEISPHAAFPAFCLRIDYLDIGTFSAMISFPQFHEGMTPAGAVVLLFEGWGRRTEDYAASMDQREHQGRVTAVVSRGRGVLLV